MGDGASQATTDPLYIMLQALVLNDRMFDSGSMIAVTTDARLVILSVLIALAGAWSTLDIMTQGLSLPGATRRWWQIGSGLTLGLSIWAMHFTAILSHQLAIPVGYSFPIVLLSFVIAVGGSLVGILLVSHTVMSWFLTISGSVIIGITIVGMHFVAMSALRLAAVPSYDLKLVILSNGTAVVAALGAFGSPRFPQQQLSVWVRQLLSALLLGSAICGMHYLAMAAVSFHAENSSTQPSATDGSLLAIVIGIAVLLLLTLTQLSAFFGRRLAMELALAETRQQNEFRLEQLVQQRTQELEAAKRLADTANQTKSAFLATMSHELRTPLTGIMGFSSVLLEEAFGPLNPKQQQYMTIVHQASQVLLDLINDLLDLAKIEAGQADFVWEQIAVSEICQGCLSLVEAAAERKDLQLGLEINPEVVICEADPRRLRQILLNLLSNAIKFTESGSVTLRVDRAAEGIQFSVTDTGIGIAATDQAKVFKPFQQLDNGFDRKYAGTGLGLALSQDLARLHGGEITLQSELGRGSCFTFRLPDRQVTPETEPE